MLLVLVTRTDEDTLLSKEVADIIYRTIRVGVKLEGQRRSLITHTPFYETSSKDISVS